MKRLRGERRRRNAERIELGLHQALGVGLSGFACCRLRSAVESRAIKSTMSARVRSHSIITSGSCGATGVAAHRAPRDVERARSSEPLLLRGQRFEQVILFAELSCDHHKAGGCL